LEAAFAASNTNIVRGSYTACFWWFKVSRILLSNKGKTWSTYTPIIQGKAMTGIFTADFMMLKMVLLLEEITFLDKILVIKHVQLMVVKHGN
jgi:hypothetical protein